MSPRTGRPKEDTARRFVEGVRLDDAEKAMLDFCVKKTGLAKTEVLRRGLELIYKQLTDQTK